MHASPTITHRDIPKPSFNNIQKYPHHQQQESWAQGKKNAGSLCVGFIYLNLAAKSRPEQNTGQGKRMRATPTETRKNARGWLREGRDNQVVHDSLELVWPPIYV